MSDNNELAVLAVPTNNVLAPMAQVSIIKGDYVQHPHVQAKNFPQIQQVFGKSPCNEATPVLISGPTITKLEPFQFFMTPYYAQYYAEADMQGVYTRCYPINERAPKEARECIDSVVICILQHDDDTLSLRPARMRLKSGKCQLLKSAYDHLAAMDQKDKKLAPLIKSGISPYNFQTFTASYKQETGKASKKAYYVATATPELTTTDEVKLLQAAMKSQDFIKAYNICVEGQMDVIHSANSMGANIPV